jgi:hypothetical protein
MHRMNRGGGEMVDCDESSLKRIMILFTETNVCVSEWELSNFQPVQTGLNRTAST